MVAFFAIANKVYGVKYQNKESNTFEVINKKTQTGHKDVYFVKRGSKLIVRIHKKQNHVTLFVLQIIWATSMLKTIIHVK